MSDPEFSPLAGTAGGATVPPSTHLAPPAYSRQATRPGSRLAMCLWLPTFELRLELVRSPELDATSVALLTPTEGTRGEIWQVSERAGAHGVQPGMPVSKAVGLCPSLTLLEPDPAHYDAAAESMLEALSGLSPILEPAGRGRVFAGVDGLERLYGSPNHQVDRAARLLLRVFPGALVASTRIGWAPGKFGAWVAAVGARPGDPRIVPEDELPAFLAHCPVSALPVAPLTIERLERLEISTLGALTRLPESALVGQFGRDGSDAYAWASGQRIDRVRPWHRPRPIRTSLDFPVPAGQSGILHGALDRLLERALARPERRGRSVRAARLGGRLEGGGSWVVDTVLREPTARPEQLAFALRSRMALTPPTRAVETLIVELTEFGAPSTQPELFGRRSEGEREAGGRTVADGEVPDRLRDAVRELKLRIGYSPLYRVVEIDPWSRIPERRHALLGFDP